MAAYNSVIYLTGRYVKFLNNKGSSGAAIHIESSYLILQEPLYTTFINNTALFYGGAVYIDNKISQRDRQKCGIQVMTQLESKQPNKLKIVLKFQGNVAGLAGDMMYVTPLYNCSVYYHSKKGKSESSFNWASIINLPTSGNSMKGLSSEPVEICSCHTKTSSQTVCPKTTGAMISSYPGKQIQLSLYSIDASGNIVYSAATASVATMRLNKLGLIENLFLKKEQMLIPLSGRSVCDPLITKLLPNAKCNITITSILLSFGQWLGDVSNTLGISFVCPPGNCLTRVSYVNVTHRYSLCQDSKEGVLCGRCHVGLSVVFGSSECRECSNIWMVTIIGYIHYWVYCWCLSCYASHLQYLKDH